MERETLLGLLRSGRADAWGRAADALDRGAAWDEYGGAETFSLQSIFRRRRRIAAKAGQYSVGFEAAVHALNSWGERRLTLGTIDDRPRNGLVFQLFLNSESAAIVACFAIEPPAYRGKFPRPAEGAS